LREGMLIVRVGVDDAVGVGCMDKGGRDENETTDYGAVRRGEAHPIQF
jgi:hypothetical protein